MATVTAIDDIFEVLEPKSITEMLSELKRGIHVVEKVFEMQNTLMMMVGNSFNTTGCVSKDSDGSPLSVDYEVYNIESDGKNSVWVYVPRYKGQESLYEDYTYLCITDNGIRFVDEPGKNDSYFKIDNAHENYTEEEFFQLGTVVNTSEIAEAQNFVRDIMKSYHRIIQICSTEQEEEP